MRRLLCFLISVLLFVSLEGRDSYSWDRRYYLATFPRSGNHWMRYLIEEATGIATSSVYRDPDPLHLPILFPWGGYCCKGGYEGKARYPRRGESVVVKTHFPALSVTPYDELPAQKIIRIVRHPLDSIYSYYVYAHAGAAEEILPQDFLVQAVEDWKRFQMHWDGQDDVVNISYEELLLNPQASLSLVLAAAGYPFSEESVQRAVQKYPPQGGALKHIHHYTVEQIQYVLHELSSLMQKHGYASY